MRDPTPPPETAPASAGTRIPALFSLGAILLVAAAGIWVALDRGNPDVDMDANRTPAIIHATLIKDVLTGRLLGTDGMPLRPDSGWGSARQPVRLRFVPSGDSGAASAAIDGLLTWVQARTGYALRGATLQSYGLVVEEIASGRCDVAFLTAASYARARFSTENNDRDDDEIEAILSAVRQGSPAYPGSDLAYRGAILVPKDSPLQTLEDLRPEITVAMGNRTSGAGSILPSALFNSMGLNPKVLRLEGYPIIISAVAQGSAQAGCIWWSPPNQDNPQNDARIMVQRTIPDIFEKTRILGFTPWIPNEPVVVRKGLPERVKRTLARAIALYVNTKGRTQAGRRELEAIGSLVGYIPATNADYKILLETIEQAFANDPEGWRDFQGKRR